MGAGTSPSTFVHVEPYFLWSFWMAFSGLSTFLLCVYWSVLKEHLLKTSRFLLCSAFPSPVLSPVNWSLLHVPRFSVPPLPPGSAWVPPLCSVAGRFFQLTGTIRWITWLASCLSQVTVFHCLMSSTLKTIVTCILSVVTVTSSWRLKGKCGPLLSEVEAIPLLFFIFWVYFIEIRLTCNIILALRGNSIIWYLCILCSFNFLTSFLSLWL